MFYTFGIIGGVLILLSGFLVPHREPNPFSFLLFLAGLALFFYGVITIADIASALTPPL